MNYSMGNEITYWVPTGAASIVILDGLAPMEAALSRHYRVLAQR